MNEKQGGNRVYKDTDYHETHLIIAKEIGDRAKEGRAYGYLGIAYQSLGDYQKAFGYHEKVAKEIGDRAGKGGAYGNLGNPYQTLSDYQKAIEYHEIRLNIAEEMGDRAGERRAFGNFW